MTPAPTCDRLTLVDTTLRDGAQAPGVALSPAQRIAIAQALDRIGVDEIEVGCPVMGESERDVIRQIAAMKPACRLTAWCRADEADLEAAARCNLCAVHLSVPGSDLQLQAFDKSWSWVTQRLSALIPKARRQFAFVSVGLMDASRCRPQRLVELARLCDEQGVDRLRLADTVGLWNPRTAVAAVHVVRETAPRLTVGVHAHNDLGMATANTLSAIEAGVRSADVTVLGLGERAGNAPLEELVLALLTTTAFRSHVDPRGLAGLCDLVAACAGQLIPARKPIVGSDIFHHESGLHVRAVLRDPRSFEPYDPGAVGHQQRRLELGTHSGRAGLLAALAGSGFAPSAAVLDALLDRVRDEAAGTRQSVPADRAAAICRSLVQDVNGLNQEASPCAV